MTENHHNGNGRNGSGEKKQYGRPAGGFGRSSRGGEKKSGAPSGEKRFERKFDRSGAPSGEKRFERKFDREGAPTGEKRFERKFDRSGAPSGEKRFERKFDRSGAPSGEKRFEKRGFSDQGRGSRPSGSFGRPASGVKEESTGLNMNSRRVALDVLNDVHQNGAFAALSLDEHLRKARLEPADRRLVTGIVYGTLENQIRIDYVLNTLMDHPTHEPLQRDILRLSAYQVLFLDRVPDSAAVNEAVKLARVLGMEAATGFINAVLRNLSRGKDTFEWPKKEDDIRQYLHIMSSTPMWLVDRLIADYGEETACEILMWREKDHPIVVRANMLKLDDEKFDRLLEGKAWRVEKGIAPHARLVYGAQEITFDNDYRSGMFSIQGQSSMLAAEALGVKNGMKVLDACAAPGGKSAYLCESMQLTGRVFSWELHENRILLLEGVKRRLALDNMRIAQRDASVYREDMDSTLDAVLLDAPCSGLGVLTQKPDIKLRLQPEDIPAIAETQKKLLDTVCRYVRPGGVLVYSTCSILPEENAEQVRDFLARHPEYTMDTLPDTLPAELTENAGEYGLQLLGCRDGVEGFFMARMRRKA